MGGIISKVKQNLSVTTGDQNERNKIVPKIQSQSQSPLFKLNVDCVEKIFDYLALQDVHSMGQTCRALQEFVGEYFQINYVGEVYVEPTNLTYPFRWDFKWPGFDRFVPNTTFIGNTTFMLLEERACYIANNSNPNVKQIHFIRDNLTIESIEHLRNILQNIESVAISECEIDTEVCELFPKLCPNLKHLYIRSEYIVPRIEMLMLYKYPKLEHFHWSRTYGKKVNELKTFFELNPHVRSFGTDMDSLEVNGSFFIDSRVKLDDLTIENVQYFIPRSIIGHRHFNLVDELYEKGIFKRLHYNMICCDQKMIDQMVALHPLKSLRVHFFDSDNGPVNFPSGFANLVELEVGHLVLRGGSFKSNIIAHQLVNLERIYFTYADLNEFLPFLRHSVRLKKLKIDVVKKNDGNNVLNLSELNEERKKLGNARKVIIYIDEKTYLATKWAINGKEFSLIAIRRASSHRRGHQYLPQ